MTEVAMRPSRPITASLCVGLLLGAPMVGCSSGRVNRNVELAANRGEYGQARAALQSKLSDDRSDRAYILDRLRLLILTLADGQPAAAEQIANETSDLLRTQGLTADRTTSAAIINERAKIWKGEPFEQALAYTYIGIQKAEKGEWDNARAALLSSLFLLKDFGENERGERLTSEDLVRRAAEADARGKQGDDVIDHGYTPVKTNYALGYLLSGVANAALGRSDEAADNLREAQALVPGLEEFSRALQAGEYNTVFVLDYGRGPVKQAYGMDDALVRFVPITSSDNRPLRVLVESGSDPADVAPAADINVMATDLAWNNLEDVREAKSVIGTALLAGGLVVATAPQGRNESDEARTNRALIGAGIAVLGGLMKASASADVRHCEFLPQRVYVTGANIPAPNTTVTLELAGDPSGRIVLRNVSPPTQGRLQMRYVKLPPYGAPWLGSGQIIYANDAFDGRVPGDELPYIMGGRCVRTPTPETIRRYQAAGNLRDLTASDLANMYREEGITFTVEDQMGRSAAHVLEGGTSLVMPLPGTAGYQRLFGQEHAPYQAKSDLLKQYLESRAKAAAQPEARVP